MKRIKIPNSIYSVEELLMVASLSKLRYAIFSFPNVNNYTDLLDLVIQFIKAYTKLGRDFRKKCLDLDLIITCL